MNVLIVDGQVYVRYPKDAPAAQALGTGDRWLRVDTGRLSPSALGVQDVDDPAGIAKYVRSATSVQRVDGTHFGGTLDLTKSGLSAEATQAYGEAAHAVPFDAAVDDRGRLSQLYLMVVVDGTQPTTFLKFLDVGTKVTAGRPPAAEVLEAPDSFYRSFKK